MKMPELPPITPCTLDEVREIALSYGEQVRKACAQACEELSDRIELNPPDNLFQRGRMQGAWDCAAAIRGDEK